MNYKRNPKNKSSLLLDKLSEVTSAPGVYLMKDPQEGVLYVGKALNLKKRLSSYFTKLEQTDIKTTVLVKKITDFEIIITKTENEALILESSLIKKYKPRYNVNLKDDKRYPSLRLDMKELYPSLEIVRKIKKDGSIYFGPYSSANSVRKTLKFIHKTFKIRKCKNKSFKKRSRPCLNYQMGTCLAPCFHRIEKAVYAEILKEVILFLRGRTPELLKKLQIEMTDASNKLKYERAAEIRDRIFALEKTLEKQVSVTTDFADRDVMAIAGNNAGFLLSLLTVRGGFLIGSRYYRISETMSSKTELVGSFIRQYYEKGNYLPKEIFVSDMPEDVNLTERFLTKIRGNRVHIKNPLRGEKAKIVAMAKLNAQKELQERIAADTANLELLSRLKKKLNLQRLPHRIECFDNSNFSGTQPVSAMVVFKNGRPEKTAYRKYKIKTVNGQDDYASMAEIIKRRYGKGRQSEPLPDLVIVDGGKGQLNVTSGVLKAIELHGTFDVIGIAKKDKNKGEIQDKVYIEGRRNPINFGTQGNLILLLQRIRDEAHRFVITYQKKRRIKKTIHSVLDSVDGIGKKRKAMLLKHFGSIKRIRAAKIEDLLGLPGITSEIAKSIKMKLSI